MHTASDSVGANMTEESAVPPHGHSKAHTAMKTISEVAEILELPTHVLRFWETKFPQIQPLKRAGGRRFYRTEDIEALRLIRALLHERGFTIKGAAKVLPELLKTQQSAQELPALTDEFAQSDRHEPTGLEGMTEPLPASQRHALLALRRELEALRGLLGN